VGDRDLRLDDLEARYAFLEDLVQQLEGIVAARGRELDALREELRRLRETVARLRADQPEEGPEPPPPHY
jgi:uncharacterized coiled-coil protein SlyX